MSRVYKKFGAGAVGIIKDNPYILCNGELSIPFAKADAIAMSLGTPLDSRERILSGITFVLRNVAAQNGHTCYPIGDTVTNASELLGVERDKVENTLEKLIDNGDLSLYKKNGESFLMTNETAEDEDAVARNLTRIMRSAGRFGAMDISVLIEKVETTLGISFAPLQREAIFASLENGVMILTGGPGTLHT